MSVREGSAGSSRVFSSRVGTHRLVHAHANLVEDLLEDLVALDLLALALVLVLHGVVDGIGHHLLLHVHSRRLLLKLVHDTLDLIAHVSQSCTS